ncbi:uracil-DNA glycosylase-like protein [Tirmania nivea]|nr:uracil-DNA glycosylase-like protein [Tirmania nivea]
MIDNISPNRGRRKTKTASPTALTIITTSAKVTKPTSGNNSSTKSSEPRALLRSPFSTKIPERHLEPLLVHPAPLLDILAPSLLLIFIGTNPGLLTAYTGHTYSSPTNSFWKLLHASKLTPTENGLPLQATEDRTLPKRFLLGNTNIVERASRSQEDLSREEMVLGAGRAVKKIGRWRPEAVCVVGKGVWEAFVGWGRKMRLESGESGIWLVQTERIEPPQPKYEGPWEGARVYVVPSTSGLVTMPFTKKLEIWEGVGEWVGRRREDRGFTCS